MTYCYLQFVTSSLIDENWILLYLPPFTFQATDVGKRDRLGLKVFDYNIEYASGEKKLFTYPKSLYKDSVMKKVVMENFQLDFGWSKHKCFGNDRLRGKFGNPF